MCPIFVFRIRFFDGRSLDYRSKDLYRRCILRRLRTSFSVSAGRSSTSWVVKTEIPPVFAVDRMFSPFSSKAPPGHKARVHDLRFPWTWRESKDQERQFLFLIFVDCASVVCGASEAVNFGFRSPSHCCHLAIHRIFHRILVMKIWFFFNKKKTWEVGAFRGNR